VVPMHAPVAAAFDELMSVDRISRISDSLWDAAAGGDVLASRGWLAALEQAGIAGLQPHYLMRQSANGPCAAVCYEAPATAAGSDFNCYLLGRLYPLSRRIGLSFAPALVCAPYRGYSGHLLGPDPTAAIAMVEDLAAKRRLPVVLTRILDEDTELRDLLLARAYHRTVFGPVARLDVTWSSFEGYLATLRKSARGTVRDEMRRCREAGVAIAEIDDPSALAAELYALATAHNRRRNGTGLPFSEAFFPALKVALGQQAVFYGAFHGQDLLGFALFLRDDSTAHALYIGMRERKEHFAYFNLAYYRPIIDAIGGGLRQINFGTMLYELKARRGCRILPTSIYYRASSRARHLALTPYFRAHRAWIGRTKFARALALAKATRSR